MRFSILIPAYKSRFLKEAIESVLCQTYNDFEIIIVNDASPEDLDSIVNCYQDSRIRYYKNNVGFGAIHVVGNWNKCLNNAIGDYVICMGDDDKLLPSCLEEYKELIEDNPGIGLLHGWTEIIDENSNPFQLTSLRGLHESAMSLLWNRWIGGYNRQYIGDFCFERKWLIDHGGFYDLPLAWGSDDISAIIGASKNGVANTQTIVFQYRRSRYTISRSGNEKIKLDAVRKEQEWYDAFLREAQSNSVDKLYQSELLDKIERHFEKKKGSIIASHIKEHGLFFFFYWLIHKKYQVNIKTLLYSLIQSLNK